jgi:hypothetical protein
MGTFSKIFAIKFLNGKFTLYTVFKKRKIQFELDREKAVSQVLCHLKFQLRVIHWVPPTTATWSGIFLPPGVAVCGTGFTRDGILGISNRPFEQCMSMSAQHAVINDTKY